MDCGYLSEAKFQEAYQMAADCRNQIKGFRKYLRDYVPPDS